MLITIMPRRLQLSSTLIHDTSPTDMSAGQGCCATLPGAFRCPLNGQQTGKLERMWTHGLVTLLLFFSVRFNHDCVLCYAFFGNWNLCSDIYAFYAFTFCKVLVFRFFTFVSCLEVFGGGFVSLAKGGKSVTFLERTGLRVETSRTYIRKCKHVSTNWVQ